MDHLHQDDLMVRAALSHKRILQDRRDVLKVNYIARIWTRQELQPPEIVVMLRTVLQLDLR